MLQIRFPNEKSEARGLGFLAERFRLTTFKSGQTWVPPGALEALASRGIPFSFEGWVSYGELVRKLKVGAKAIFNAAKAPKSDSA